MIRTPHEERRGRQVFHGSRSQDALRRWAATLSRSLMELWPAARVVPVRGPPKQGAFWPTVVGWEPLVDVLQTWAGLVVTVALPGVRPEDVNTVACHGEILIEGTRRERPPQWPAQVHCIELPRGRFSRSMALPFGAYQLVHKEHVDGCLILTLHRLDSGHALFPRSTGRAGEEIAPPAPRPGPSLRDKAVL